MSTAIDKILLLSQENFDVSVTSTEIGMNVSVLATNRSKFIEVLEWVVEYLLFSNKYDESDIVNMFIYAPLTGKSEDGINKTAAVLMLNPFINMEDFNNNTILELFRRDEELSTYKDILLNNYIPKYFDLIDQYSLDVESFQSKYFVDDSSKMLAAAENRYKYLAFRKFCHNMITSGLSPLITYIFIAVLKRKKYLTQNYNLISYQYNREQIIQLLTETIDREWGTVDYDRVIEFNPNTGLWQSKPELILDPKSVDYPLYTLLVELEKRSSSLTGLSNAQYLSMSAQRLANAANGLKPALDALEYFKQQSEPAENMPASAKIIYDCFLENYDSADDVLLKESIPKQFSAQDGFSAIMMTLVERQQKFFKFADDIAKGAQTSTIDWLMRLFLPQAIIDSLFKSNMQTLKEAINSSLNQMYSSFEKTVQNQTVLVGTAAALTGSAALLYAAAQKNNNDKSDETAVVDVTIELT